MRRFSGFSQKRCAAQNLKSPILQERTGSGNYMGQKEGKGESLNVLMFGWEFPPYSSGGLGTACYGLTKGLSSKEIGVTFVMPGSHNSENSGNLRILTTGSMKTIKVKSLIKPYLSSLEYLARNKKRKSGIYGSTLFEEVSRFAEIAKDIAKKEEFDVIHAHDWMTFRAGINAKKVSGKPLVVHVHATDFDRTGGNPNQGVYKIEKAGMHYADKIISVSIT